MTQDQAGRIALVTGANTGLGYQTALGLAKAGGSTADGARPASEWSRLRPTRAGPRPIC